MADQSIGNASLENVGPNSLRPSSTTNLPKLDGTNFQSWQDMVTIHLKLRGLAAALTNEAIDEMIDLQAKLVLLETMDENHRGQVRGCATAKQVIERLTLVYADKGAANIVRLMYEYYSYKKRPEDSMSIHIGKMDTMRRALADIGEEQSERLYQVHLIRSLPKEYYSILELWELTHQEMQTTPNLVSRLLKKETDLKNIGLEEEQALLVRQPQARRPNSSLSFEERRKIVEERKKVTRCNACGKRGHWERECNDRSGAKQSNNLVTEVNFQVGGHSTQWSDKFILDSGATSHMTKHREWFAEYSKVKEPSVCMAGDGYGLSIVGKGTVVVKAKTGVVVKLENVLHIPQLAANLISVGAAAGRGIETVFKGNRCEMKKGNTCMIGGTRANGDGIYVLECEVMGVRASAFTMAKKRSLTEWHKVLGHASKQRINDLLQQTGHSKFGPDEEIECSACPMGKGQHVPHPSIGKPANEPGLIHVDVAYVSNKSSLEGLKYYLLCKDEASEFVMIFPIQSKDQVPARLATMAIEFENISGYRVREIRSDNGSEFTSRVVKLWCLREKIRHQTSAPYTPQQNGMAEREIRNITEIARTLLIDSEMSTMLWPEAVQTAAYIKNRLPTARSTTTPLERLTGQKPKIAHLAQFGSEVHVLRNADYLTKFDSRTEEGFLVGFTGRSNTYKVYIPSKNKVIISSDVIFARHKKSPETERKAEDCNVQSEVTPVRSPCIGEVIVQDNVDRMNNQVADQSNDMEAFPSTSTPLARIGDRVIGKNGRPYIDTTELDKFFEDRREQERESRPEQEGVDEQHNTSRRSSEAATRALVGQSEIANQILDGTMESNASAEQRDQAGILNQTFEVAVEPRVNTEQRERAGMLNQTFEVAVESRANTEQRERAGMLNQTFEVAVEPRANTVEQAPVPPPRNTSLFNCIELERTPSNYHEAVAGPDAMKWQDAINAELSAHGKNCTWQVVDRPKVGVALSTRWVFSIKRDNAGQVERYKARLVARGFEQREGIDYHETFSPVVSIDAVRSVIALAAARRSETFQFDISTAFLNGRIEEDVYVEPPRGIEIGKDKCLKLLKALYGLKQAPRCWNSTFNEALIELGLSPLETDRCIYQSADKDIILLVYVDDGLLVGTDIEKCKNIVDKLEEKFELKRLKGENFLGMQIKKTKHSICLYQERYAHEILKKFKMEECSPVSTPMLEISSLVSSDHDQTTAAPYREAIGCIQYLAGRTRPDLLFAINFLSRFNENPLEIHWQALKRVMRYIKGTLDSGLEYECGTEPSITAYSDADWAGDPATRLSTSGSLVLVANGPVLFSSTKQTSVARSTCEAEYVALSDTARDTIWLKQLYRELGVITEIPVIRVDNSGAIKIAERADTSKKSKHIDIRYHFVKQLVERREVSLEKVEGQNQLADFMTKPLNGPRLTYLSNKSNIVSMKYVLSMLLMLTVAAQATHTRVGRTIFLQDTDHIVFKGIRKGRVVYRYVEPCKMDTTSIEWSSPHNVKRVSAERFRVECNQEVNRSIKPVLAKVSKCLPKNRQRGRRVRRFEPITIATVATIVGASGGGTAAYSWLSSSSSYNRLNQKDIVDANQTSEIEMLKSVTKQQETELQRAQSIRNDTIVQLDTQLKIIDANKQAIIHVADYGSHIGWHSASNHYIIKADQAHIQALVSSCQKERLSTNAISKLTGAPEFSEWDEEDTHIENVDQIDETAFTIDYHVFIRALDTKIYEVADFKVWANIFDEPTPQAYVGPAFALHNSTNNCTIGLDSLKRGRVYSNCTLENFRDPRLDDFKTIIADEKEIADIMRPSIYQNHAGSYIYCFQYKIQIEGRLMECPSYPFFLPITTSFTLLNTTHEVLELNINQLRGQVESLNYTVSIRGKDEEIEEANKAVANLFQKNRRTLEIERGKENPMLGGHILPAVVGAVSLLVGMVTTMIILKCCLKGQMKEQTVTNNIYSTTSVPLAPMPPPPPPHYYPQNYSQGIYSQPN